jgi:hypothetical protein
VAAVTDKEISASNAQSTRLKSYLILFEIVIELVYLDRVFRRLPALRCSVDCPVCARSTWISPEKYDPIRARNSIRAHEAQTEYYVLLADSDYLN